MPGKTQSHYKERFKKFIKGWQDRGYLVIPDEAPEDLESKNAGYPHGEGCARSC